jgi:hypothetical protein
VDADNSDTQVTNYTEWYRGIIHQPIYDGLTILPSSATTKNQVWYFKVIVNDGETNSTTYISAGVEILNTPPQATAVTLTPSTPNTSVNLIADWGFQDNDSIDSQSAQYIVRWYKDGVIQSAYNDETTVFSTTTSKDEKWNFTVKVHDGTNYSIQYNSSIVTIINSAPTASSLTITTNPTTTDNLVASWSAADIDGDDPDNYLTDAILRWYNDTGSSWQLIATTNGNSPVLEAGNTSKGETWRYELEVYDGTAYSSIYTSANTTILSSRPTVTNPSFNKSTGVGDGDTINITYSYSDADGDPEVPGNRIVYWYKNGAHQSGKENDTILLSSETAEGEFWQYIVRVYDGYNYSLNATSIIVIIGLGSNTAPIVGNLTLTANTNTTLVAGIKTESYKLLIMIN